LGDPIHEERIIMATTARKRTFTDEGGKALHPGGETHKAQEGVEAFESWKVKEAALLDMARSEGRDRQYEEALKPVFDSVLGLVQIVTGGDPQKVTGLISQPGQFFERLIEDEAGLLRGFLMARAMHEISTRPSRKDPLEWAKFMVEIMNVSAGMKGLAHKGKVEEKRGAGEQAVDGVVDKFLSRLETTSS
jgi:hypothetical protein